MKNLTPFLVLILIFTGCTGSLSNNPYTPQPEELLEKPIYQEQIDEIDEKRFEEEKESFRALIKKNRITKRDNGTKPVLIKVERVRPKENEELLDENGDILIDPLHNKEEVQEYYVLKKEEPSDDSSDVVELEKQEDEEIVLVEEVPAAIEDEEIIAEVEDTTVDFKKTTEDQKAEEVIVVISEETKLEETPVIVEDKKEEKVEEPKSVNPQPVEHKEDKKNTFAELPTQNVPVPTKRPKKPKKVVKKPKNKKLRADWDGRKTAKQYTKLTLKALEKHGGVLLNPKHKLKKNGFARYCKRYNSLNKNERKQFWLMFISGLSRFESGFRPHVTYTENFKTNGKNVVSRGLLQMSIGSVNNNIYKCNIKRAQDLHSPSVNLTCAVKVMNHWVKKDQRIYGRQMYTSKGKTKTRWLGVGRYWAPIRVERYTGNKKKKFLELGSKINSMDICR